MIMLMFLAFYGILWEYDLTIPVVNMESWSLMGSHATISFT